MKQLPNTFYTQHELDCELASNGHITKHFIQQLKDKSQEDEDVMAGLVNFGETLQKSITKANEEIKQLKARLETEKTDYKILQDKLHRRNMQIKDLKEKIQQDLRPNVKELD